MLRRLAILVILLSIAMIASPRAFDLRRENPASRAKAAEDSWDVSATASTIARWAADLLFGQQLNIKAIVLSVREDGVFLDAGSTSGVTAGQVFEIYRAAHENTPEEVLGRVQIAWTREDYAFASPLGEIDLPKVSSLHFARLVRVPPVLEIRADLSLGGDQAQVSRLIGATSSILTPRSVKVTTEESKEPSWKLVLTPAQGGRTIGVTLSTPGGEVAGTVILNPYSGERLSNEAWLDPGYISGAITPFEHFLAPPGRRSVRIASGNIAAGAGDELAVLDGSDLYIYDTSGTEPRLLNSLSISVPPASVRHREDVGSLELVDFDDNGTDEVCIAPPGGSQGEIWGYNGNEWAPLGSLSDPPRASSSGMKAILVGRFLSDLPALESSSLTWVYPLSQRESVKAGFGFSPIALDSLPDRASGLPDCMAINKNGILYRVPSQGDPVSLGGSWGNCVRVARTQDGAVAIVTKPTLRSDKLTILDTTDGKVLAEFPYSDGPIIDIAVGDINRDGKSEILVAAIHPEGVRIYY